MFEAGCTRINTVIQQYDKVCCDLCIWTTVVGRHGANISEIANESNPNTSKHTYSSVARNSQGPKTKKRGNRGDRKQLILAPPLRQMSKETRCMLVILTSYMLKFPSLLVNLSLSMFLCSGSCLKVQSGLVQPVVLQKKHSFLNGLRQRRETIFYFKIRL